MLLWTQPVNATVFTTILICIRTYDESTKTNLYPRRETASLQFFKKESAISDISEILKAVPGTVFTALLKIGGIKPIPSKKMYGT